MSQDGVMRLFKTLFPSERIRYNINWMNSIEYCILYINQMLFLEHNNDENALPLKNRIQFSVHAVFFGFRANLRNTQYFCTNRFVCFEEQFSDIFMRASRDLSLVYCKMLILLIIINDSQTNMIFCFFKLRSILFR